MYGTAGLFLMQAERREQMMELTGWLNGLKRELTSAFGDRLLFFGLQGSYGRGAATDASDIDVVVILDRVSFADLETYRRLLDRTEHRELVCGFVAGRAELEGWERSDLLGLLLDTRPIVGSLEALCPPFCREDARLAVRIGVCNLYHACSHNYLHTRSPEILRGLYKSARFVVRMRHYAGSGAYIASMRELEQAVPEPDRQLLQLCRAFPPAEEADFDRLSRVLLEWASAQLAGGKTLEGGTS